MSAIDTMKRTAAKIPIINSYVLTSDFRSVALRENNPLIKQKDEHTKHKNF